MRTIAIALLAVGVPSVTSAQEAPTYDAVVAGMSCKQSALQGERQLDCEYKVGRGLQFTIAGVGQSDAAITVAKASGYDSDFYFTFGVMHGCVIVKPGTSTRDAALKAGVRPDMAFVSPKTGKVYKTWPECQKGS